MTGDLAQHAWELAAAAEPGSMEQLGTDGRGSYFLPTGVPGVPED